MHPFDKLLSLDEISVPTVAISQNVSAPVYYRATNLNSDWNRGDGIAQGGVVAALAVKAIMKCAGPEYTRPVTCQIQYLDQTLMGREVVFGLQVLRRGNRFVFIQGVAHQAGRSVLGISATVARMDIERDVLHDVGISWFKSEPLPFSIPPPPQDCQFYDQLMGYQNENNTTSKFSRPVERDIGLGAILGREREPGMWSKFKRLLDPKCAKEFQNTKASPKSAEYWSNFAKVDTVGWGLMDGRNQDVYSAAFFCDNFPPLSLWSFYKYADPDEIPKRAPGWTTISLSLVFLRQPEEGLDKFLLTSNLEIANQDGRGVMEISVWSDPKSHQGRNLLCIGRQVCLLHANTDKEREERIRKREERRDELVSKL
jgi:hypothetical protein